MFALVHGCRLVSRVVPLLGDEVCSGTLTASCFTEILAFCVREEEVDEVGPSSVVANWISTQWYVEQGRHEVIDPSKHTYRAASCIA